MADQLMVDIKEIVAKANAEQLSPLQLANGAKELLDEVATGKITGEEDRYSHTDLWDFNANVEGSKAAIASLRPVLEERDPALVDHSGHRVRQCGHRARASTARATAGSCTTNCPRPSSRTLSDAINALAEPISKVAAVVAEVACRWRLLAAVRPSRSPGAGAAGLASGAGRRGARRRRARLAEPPASAAPCRSTAPHQAGIITAAQDRLHFVAFDVITKDRPRWSSCSRSGRPRPPG